MGDTPHAKNWTSEFCFLPWEPEQIVMTKGKFYKFKTSKNEI